MEVQMAAQGPKSKGRGSEPSDSHHGGGAIAKPIPGYLRPSAGSSHHVCKYGGTHTFEDHKEAHRPQPWPPRKQPPASAPAPAPESHNHSRVLVKVRSVFWRRVGDSTTATQKPSKAAAGKDKAAKGAESVEWKDIVAYDTVVPPHGSSPQPDKSSAQVTGSGGEAKKKDVMKKGKKSYGKAKVHEQVEGLEGRQNEPLGTNTNTDSTSVRPPKAKNKPAALLVENMGIDQETLQGYQILSPSLAQSRANLLRDLEKEMMAEEPANVKQESTPLTYSLDPEEYAAATESSRPIPAHRRVQSMSMSISSRSVRYPFARQASKNSGTAFKLRSRSTRAPAVLPPKEEKPARLRSRRGEDPSSATSGRGIHLRIRSLRRCGVGGSGGAGTSGFIVPAVALRHQKTLEKKKSQRLYNSHIEETATRLVKTRKSRVKALVGAFESVISKIAK
ncbi:uncharacterized protein [Miscanthus floridulus]|uniref:uncharacterized protein n=1 Tax=Miscanthus floridulus TaxID=154761 RepID=UPI003459835C